MLPYGYTHLTAPGTFSLTEAIPGPFNVEIDMSLCIRADRTGEQGDATPLRIFTSLGAGNW